MTNHDIAINISKGNQGSFKAALGDAYCRADNINREKLEQAFPNVFNANKGPVFVGVIGNVMDGFMICGPYISSDEVQDKCGSNPTLQIVELVP